MTSARARFTLAVAAIAALLVAASCRRPLPERKLFQTSTACGGCHDGLRTAAGEDVSIQRAWQRTMMANSAHDPYWQASVRREIVDHAGARAAIEDECSICHMPMATFTARASGGHGTVFARLGGAGGDAFAGDGVSCTVCHQMESDRFGSPESFNGGFAIDRREASPRRAYGRFAIDSTTALIMTTGSGFAPIQAAHLEQSDLCATCHTLRTGSAHSRGPLPEQVPYLEWLQSDFKTTQSCQSCHMPRIEGEAPIASMAMARPGFGRHSFLGANFVVPRLLSANRDASGTAARSWALDEQADATRGFLRAGAAKVRVEDARADSGRLVFTVRVEPLTGHKLPTAYPSRRAWLHVTVRDAGGRTVFESGAPRPDGSIAGNDNDEDAARFEPHYAEITRPDQVEVYESVMIDDRGAVTTGLLDAVDYVKDNRLLPRGFDKATAVKDTAVRGDAVQDPDFTGGGDRVRYVAAADPGARPPFSVSAELWYQPIGFRWAQNLRRYRDAEPQRFVSWYAAQARASALKIAAATASIAPGTRN